MARNLVKFQDAADRLGVTTQTVRNWAGRQLITVYRVQGSRSFLVDLNEVVGMLKAVPPSVARTPSKSLAGRARIIDIIPEPVRPRTRTVILGGVPTRLVSSTDDPVES